MDDKELLDFLDSHKQYIIGHAPSGDWSAFTVNGDTCYGSTLRDCLLELQAMHKDLNK